ncbi:MAG: hypothetical protein IJS32_02510 [Kiritimatiellae bacterium]|nr:hypothetical protein [Kiritimatiellia bacterium]
MSFLTKEEAAVVLLKFAAETHEEWQLAAILGAKCLIRAGIHKRRNHASRCARKAACQSSAKAAPGCQGLANAPEAARQSPANGEESCQTLATPEGGAE